VGFACLSEFENDGAIAPIGLACSLPAVRHGDCLSARRVDVDFEVFAPPSVPALVEKAENFPLTDFGVPSGYDPHCTATPAAPPSRRPHRSVDDSIMAALALLLTEVCAPSAFFQLR
jgi:hypothetical protein